MKPRLLLLAVAAFALFAQKPAPDQPVNRSKSRLVEVNVVVRDKNGPVTGLTQKDFTLLDKGKEQKISSFVVSSNPPAQAPGLPPNVYGNRTSLAAAPAGVTMVLMDSLNSAGSVSSNSGQAQVQAFARSQVLKALEEVKPNERVVLAVLGEHLRMLGNLTAVEGQAGFLEKWIRDNSVTGSMETTNQLHTTTDALVNIAATLRQFTGRKSLVWVAGMYPVSVDHYGAEGPPGFEATANPITAQSTGLNSSVADPTAIDRSVFQKIFSPAMEALNFAAVSVYAVDARGLADMPASQTAAGAKAGSARIQGSPSTLVPRGTDALRTLAEDSGGRAQESSNNIPAAIKQAIGDAEATYTLGFYPDPKSLDAHFHALKVQVDRPGVELHYRQGYVALPEPNNAEKQRALAIRDALANPLSVDGIGLIGAYQKVGQPKPGTYKAVVKIAAGDLELEQNGEQYSGELEILVTARAADGKDLGTSRQGLQLKLTQAQYDDVMKQGMPYPTTLDTNGEVAELRAVVCDHRSGRLGSLIMPVK